MASNTGMTRTRVGRGYPKGHTKVEIVLFLSSGRKLRKDIDKHLRINLGITEGRGISNHLSQLCKAGLTIKERGTSGKPVYYSLNPGYSSLKSIFKMIRERHRELELLPSPFWQEAICENVFYGASLDLVGTIAGEDVYGIAKADGASMVSDLLDALGHLELTDSERLRLMETQKEVTGSHGEPVGSPIHDPPSHSVIGDCPGMAADAVVKDGTESMPMVDGRLDIFSRWIPLALFPSQERGTMLSILRSSPSAFAALMGLGSGGDVLSKQALRVIYPLLLIQNMLDCLFEPARLMQRMPLLDRGLMDVLSRRSEGSLMLKALESLALADWLTGRMDPLPWVFDALSTRPSSFITSADLIKIVNQMMDD